jgi:UDP-N-acetylmuramoylalanine--D-glutamate ligase
MARPRFASRYPELAGLAVLVVGAGRSGMAAAAFAAARGARVTLSDRKTAAELREEIEDAAALGIDLRAGGNDPHLADGADLVVVSPGVPPGIELLCRARGRGIPVWGEVELASRFCRGRVIGITGSNGKSTVTTMIGTALRLAGIPGGAGGNLREPFTSLLALDAPGACHALELSSFQLETAESLRPAVAVILNLSPDHLDRHTTVDVYAAAKARLLELQDADGCAVLNADDEASARFRSAVRGRLHLFSLRREVERGAFLRDRRIVLRTEHGEDDLLEARDLPQRGAHNVANALAAALACRLAGCAPEAIIDGLRRYRPLPHRLELVAEIDGVAYYNDSKATNPSSTATALEAFEPASVHLILGGRDKGADWALLAPLLRRGVRRILLIGECAALLERAFAGVVPLEQCGTLARAVAAGARDAQPGDTVLLSPGCASFDQFRDFEDRGEEFRRLVDALREGGTDG